MGCPFFTIDLRELTSRLTAASDDVSPIQAVAFTTKAITMTASATVHPNRGSDRCSSFMGLLTVPDYGRFFLFDD